MEYTVNILDVDVAYKIIIKKILFGIFLNTMSAFSIKKKKKMATSDNINKKKNLIKLTFFGRI